MLVPTGLLSRVHTKSVESIQCGFFHFDIWYIQEAFIYKNGSNDMNKDTLFYSITLHKTYTSCRSEI